MDSAGLCSIIGYVEFDFDACKLLVVVTVRLLLVVELLIIYQALFSCWFLHILVSY